MTLKTQSFKQEFKELTYPHMKLLYNVAMKYTANPFDAEDIVQETYLTAYNKFHQLREKSKCKPWLLKILRNNFLKSYQKKKKIQNLPETDYLETIKTTLAQNDIEDLIIKAAKSKAIHTAIDKLPGKYKEVLLLYYMNDQLYKEIASALDIPIGTVMSRLTRGREHLKTILLKQIKHEQNNIVDINFRKKS
ncbi:MAG: sigma-70 family RNA polymerase sigma factor [Desulfobacteraceae bacterium]|nr:sigma-70 family RNA polymerase sigma factor [Desulfobacteraceae bacterium]